MSRNRGEGNPVTAPPSLYTRGVRFSISNVCPDHGTMDDSVPTTERRVPHISLVFREMWDSTALPLVTRTPDSSLDEGNFGSRQLETAPVH